jgi:o-succinylbenzoate---CoA ligase
MKENYFINHKGYSREELIVFAGNKLKQEGLADWERDLYTFIQLWLSPVEYISIYTSGSTGMPKEIKITKAQMLRSAKRTLEYFEVRPLENALLCLPVKYIAGMMMVVRAFVGYLNLCTLAPQQLKLEDIKEKMSFAALTPLQIDKLIIKDQHVSGIEKMILGGMPVSMSLEHKLKSYFLGKVWETYGMTETITHVAIREIGNDPQKFQALPGILFSTDERDCLMISDPLLHDEPISTNDRVELLSNTSFRLLGRADNTINSGGVKVQPEVLEMKLALYITGKYCITSVQNEILGEIVVLVVEKGYDAFRVQEGIDNLESYQRPKKIVELPQIPLTSNGKVNYDAMKKEVDEMLSE